MTIRTQAQHWKHPPKMRWWVSGSVKVGVGEPWCHFADMQGMGWGHHLRCTDASDAGTATFLSLQFLLLLEKHKGKKCPWCVLLSTPGHKWFLLWTYCTVQYAGQVGYCSLCSAYLVILELCNLPRVDLIFTCLPWADLMDSPFSTPYLLASLHADTVWLNLFCRRQKAKEKALRKMKKLMAKSGPALSDKITRWSESVLCDPLLLLIH